MQRSVLIIDDEIDQCTLLSSYLRKRNFLVDCAYTLEAGIEMLSQLKPDNLLLDNNLPDGLGWKYATLIHGLFPDIQITLMTAGDPTGDRSTAGFNRINKPMHFSELDTYLRAA